MKKSILTNNPKFQEYSFIFNFTVGYLYYLFKENPNLNDVIYAIYLVSTEDFHTEGCNFMLKKP
jgi:hypothetical protein